MAEQIDEEVAVGWDADGYPEPHSPFCPRGCDDPCHDEYDRQQAQHVGGEADRG